MKMRISGTAILIMLCAAQALAHEYWFEPESFFLQPEQKTVVHLYVGDGLVKDREERALQIDKTALFQLFSTSQTDDLKSKGREGALPIFHFSPQKAGNYLLAMERHWSYIKLPAAEFESYLREDGMDYILQDRARLGEDGREGRERYCRFLKLLVQVGDLHDATCQKRVGFKLEILPLENPYAKKIGETVRFQVWFDGQPLAGRTVFADNRESATQQMTTDKNGECMMKMDHRGLWLVRVVYMQRCHERGVEADWESFWGALTFGAP